MLYPGDISMTKTFKCHCSKGQYLVSQAGWLLLWITEDRYTLSFNYHQGVAWAFAKKEKGMTEAI